MGWKGFAIGSIAAGARGGWIGAILGGFAGDWVERRYFSRRMERHSSAEAHVAPPGALERAYAELGVSPNAEDEVVRAAYRELAKKHHPDAMRASGMDDATMASASARMARVNDAWRTVREARGMK